MVIEAAASAPAMLIREALDRFMVIHFGRSYEVPNVAWPGGSAAESVLVAQVPTCTLAGLSSVARPRAAGTLPHRLSKINRLDIRLPSRLLWFLPSLGCPTLRILDCRGPSIV